MSVRITAELAALSCFGLLQSGCFFLFDRDRDREAPVPVQPPPPPQSPPQRDEPPHVEDIQIGDWPPLGPEGVVRVQASDNRGLSSMEYVFANTTRREVIGSFVTHVVTGAELGEGYGQLLVRARDISGGFAERSVRDLLVDLSPPIVELGRTVIPAAGVGARLDLWVADAWVLGDVTLEFQNHSVTHTFEPGYPSTLGKDWDQSLVSFEAIELPAGKGHATLKVSDAAGNVMVQAFALHVDALPPEVHLVRPIAGERVSGTFEVEIAAADPGDGPVWVELFAGGAPIGDAVGTSSSVVTVDARELVRGPLALSAIARDEAGNETKTSVAIVVEAPASE